MVLVLVGWVCCSIAALGFGVWLCVAVLGVGASGYYVLIICPVVVFLVLLVRVWWVYDCVFHRLFDVVLFV